MLQDQNVEDQPITKRQRLDQVGNADAAQAQDAEADAPEEAEEVVSYLSQRPSSVEFISITKKGRVRKIGRGGQTNTGAACPRLRMPWNNPLINTIQHE